ncbi:MAG: GLPGLI family protein [Bacteroidales bacterium]|nr:GLPGLI family protein [Bacteroidales bacterium]MCF8458687.1 GLPGLI family protein [Bacteroidales bacterium]
MKKGFSIQLIVALILIAMSGNTTAQEALTGTVKYQQVTKFDFEKKEDPRWNDFIAGLPSEVNSAFILYFNNDIALYSDNPVEQEEIPREVRRAMHMQNMGKAPKPNLKKVYYDLAKNKKIEQKEFMTRDFLVESEIEIPAWKITGENRMILDYVCMSAEAEIDSQLVKAWFTPQLPISVGPDKYYGLPGLILAVEKNGETILLASGVERTQPSEETLVKPTEGKKVSEEELQEIILEKTKEMRKAMEARQKGEGKGKGRGYGRH